MAISDNIPVVKEVYGEVLFDGLPIPFATEVETYDIPIDESDIAGFDKTKIATSEYVESEESVVLTNKYLFQNPNFRFTGKPVYVKTLEQGRNIYRILKPDTSHIKTEEEMNSIKMFRKDENGNRSVLVYTNRKGEKILDKQGLPIPIVNSKCVRFDMRLSKNDENLEQMRTYLSRYIVDPKRISDDGHSVGKHAFDAAIALKILVDPQYQSTSYFSVNERLLDSNEDGKKERKYCFLLTTKEAETILAHSLPEKLIHTQIANEVAGELRSKLDSGNRKEFNRIGNNFLIWLKEFSADEPLLGVVLFNEVKYLLKFDYNKEYGSETRKYSPDDISDLFNEKNLRDTVKDSGKYYNEVKRIADIFEKQFVYVDTDSVGILFSFESKVDELIKYLEYRGIDQSTLDYFKLSGQLEEIVRPVVILKGHVCDEKVYPTTTIVTSYLERYPRNFFVNGFKKVLLKTGLGLEEVTQSGKRCRGLLDELYMNVGKSGNEVYNVHHLKGRWVDSIAQSLSKMLEIDRSKVDIYAQDAISITQKRRGKN